MDAILMLNTIRSNNSALYQERVPELDGTNWKDVREAVLGEQALTNEFCNGLVVCCAFREVENRYRWKNPLSILKKGTLPFGRFVQTSHVNPVVGTEFDGATTDDLLTQSKADIETIWYGTESKRKYKVSFSMAQLQDAFTGEAEMNALYEGVKEAMYSGDEMDEYHLTRDLVAKGIKEGKIKTIEVDYNGDETSSKDLVKLLNTLSLDMKFPSQEFNGYNMLNAEAITAGTVNARTTWCPPENQVLLIRNDVDVNTDVEVLAKAFNMSKADFMQRKINVDSFGDTDTLCFLCDERIFKIKDRLYTVRNFENGSNLTITYFLHHWQNLDLCLFGNGVAIKAKAQS